MSSKPQLEVNFFSQKQLLDRIEDPKTGIVHRDFHVTIPGDRYKQVEHMSKIFGEKMMSRFPMLEGAKTVDSDPFVTLLNRSWLPQLSCTGIDGMPQTSNAGNVLRPETNIRLSLRLPPTLDAEIAKDRLKKVKKPIIVNSNGLTMHKAS